MTHATLYGPDNVPIAVVPASWLSPETAGLLRRYFSMLLTAGLEPELFCADCGHAQREDMAEFHVTDAMILIRCACRTWHFTGPTPFTAPRLLATTLARSGPAYALIVSPPTAILTDEAARVLRAWKAFLGANHLREALRCNVCYEADLGADGTRVRVSDRAIAIECRCLRRRHYGSTT